MAAGPGWDRPLCFWGARRHVGLPCPRVLNRRRRFFAERFRRAQGEVRLTQELACQQHQVRLALGDNRIRLFGRGDQPDSGRRDAGFAADLPRECDLVTRPHGNLGMRRGTAGRAVDQVDAKRLQAPRKFDCFSDRPAALDPIGARGAEE